MNSVRTQVFDRPRFAIERQLVAPASLQVWGQSSYAIWRATSLPFEMCTPLLSARVPFVPQVIDQIADQARESYHEQ